MSDEYGFFNISGNIDKADTLIISYIGYHPLKIIHNENDTMEDKCNQDYFELQSHQLLLMNKKHIIHYHLKI